MSEGLAGLRSLVPFDAAWWGECSGGMDGLAPRNWLSGRINLSAYFARDWTRSGASAGCAGVSMPRRAGVVGVGGPAARRTAMGTGTTTDDPPRDQAASRGVADPHSRSSTCSTGTGANGACRRTTTVQISA